MKWINEKPRWAIFGPWFADSQDKVVDSMQDVFEEIIWDRWIVCQNEQGNPWFNAEDVIDYDSFVEINLEWLSSSFERGLKCVS